ncbi:hypothetical protein PORY_001214 [Pneumocystis oryctolagi]|uniref:Uncharacterized protein n=1 Tax=Pneumocystis oryctolagi TaxID=42067 RepID=A0ACB7CFA3_9ASCO|nr:hypothetical protein PORY_001214 [Pneumocystis oryctolagi]
MSEDNEISTSPDPLDMLSFSKSSYLTPFCARNSNQTRQEFELSKEIRRIGLFVDIGNDKEELFFISPKKKNRPIKTETTLSENVEVVEKDILNISPKSFSCEDSKKSLRKSPEKTKTSVKQKKKAIKHCLSDSDQNVLQKTGDNLNKRQKKKVKTAYLDKKQKLDSHSTPKEKKTELENHFDPESSVAVDDTSTTSLILVDKLTKPTCVDVCSKELCSCEEHSISIQETSSLLNNGSAYLEKTIISNIQENNPPSSILSITEGNLLNNQKKDIEDVVLDSQEILLHPKASFSQHNTLFPLSEPVSPEKGKLIEISSLSNVSAKRVVDVLRRTGHFHLESTVQNQKVNDFEEISKFKSTWTKNEWKLLEQLLIKHGKAKMALEEFLKLNNSFSKEEVKKRLKVLLFKKKENYHIYFKKEESKDCIEIQENKKASGSIFEWKNWLKW